MTDGEELERLDVDTIVEINFEQCSATGEPSALLDREGLEAAVARPWMGWGEDEFYPSIHEKAAALLHGIASRQVFENGNKRTAWVAATTFLDGNGVDLGKVETVHADMFVRAAGLDHSLDVPELAEWFRVTHERRRFGAAVDPRVEYMSLAMWGEQDPGDNLGVANLSGFQVYSVGIQDFPQPLQLVLVARVHWAERDAGDWHMMTLSVDQPRRVIAPLGSEWEWVLDAPVPSSHAHHPSGFMPTLVVHRFRFSVIQPGNIWLAVSIDGDEVGRLPFKVDRAAERIF